MEGIEYVLNTTQFRWNAPSNMIDCAILRYTVYITYENKTPISNETNETHLSLLDQPVCENITIQITAVGQYKSSTPATQVIVIEAGELVV